GPEGGQGGQGPRLRAGRQRPDAQGRPAQGRGDHRHRGPRPLPRPREAPGQRRWRRVPSRAQLPHGRPEPVQEEEEAPLMEWVETTGRTIEEAKDRALDELGVAEDGAEFEIREEPKTGLFGRLRSEARVRARVRPMQPRPKLDRRDRRGRGPKGGKGRGNGRGKRSTEAAPAPSEPQGAAVAVAEAAPAAEAPAQDSPAPATPPETAPAASDAPVTTTNGGSGRRSRRSRGRSSAPTTTDEESTEMSETELTAQGEVVRGFLVDLLDACGLEGEVTTGTGEDGAIELAVTGADLGLLIGPKGQTLQAIQELARAVLQRQRPGETHARVRVDV